MCQFIKADNRFINIGSRFIRLSVLLATLLFVNCPALAEQNQQNGSIAPNSYFHVLVYSSGLLSGFGHDHVIAATQWRGQYKITNQQNLSAQIQVDVKDLVIDRNSDRLLYPHLANKEQPTHEDIVGTKINMLSKTVLDEKRYPRILAKISTNLKTKKMEVRLILAGREAQTTADYQLLCENGKMKAKGRFRFNHANFNLTPFSALLGTIKVSEEMDFYFMAATTSDCRTFD